MIVKNPFTIEQLERKRLANLIAEQKGIKYKSAMRYLQRASAPVGKQRIAEPRFTGIKPKLKTQVSGFVEQERKRLTLSTHQETWYEKQLRTLRELGEKKERGELDHVIRSKDLSIPPLVDRLSILVGELDYENAAEILATSEDLIQKAIEGNRLNMLEDAELNEGYSHLLRDRQLQDDFDINSNTIEHRAQVLARILAQRDADISLNLRTAIADGDIDLEKIDQWQIPIRELTNTQLSKILDAWFDNQSGNNLVTNKAFTFDEMFEAMELDDWDIITQDLEDSEFWAWFRELFY